MRERRHGLRREAAVNGAPPRTRVGTAIAVDGGAMQPKDREITASPGGERRAAAGPIRMAIFSSRRFERPFLEEANARYELELVHLEPALSPATAPLARGFPVVCGFVNDRFDAESLRRLAEGGTRLVALRSAGFNNVDLAAAALHGVRVVRVPAYSPHAVAEHTIALLLALDRKLHRAYNRVREGNFALDGLLGEELFGRTVGVVGTGKIGACVARILRGFDAKVLAHDPTPDDACRAIGVEYVSLEALCAASSVVTLHCPLTPGTRHLVDAPRVAAMRPGALLVNTGRGALVDTRAVVAALKTGQLGGLAIDVYEEEEKLFFDDHSGQVLGDDVFARLLTFPNVIVTGHQAFFTRPAMRAIAATTLENVRGFFAGEGCPNEVRAP